VFSNRAGKEESMHLLTWILVGVVVGWGAGRKLQANGYGPFMDLTMGAGGAVAGGFLMRSAGYGGTVVTTLFAAICAVLLTILVGFTDGRRIYALPS
jgi:uncharacterized membrane protein YeaQ/YmgE (transglycosylase-associated protein family)